MADDGRVQLTFTKGHGTENDFILVPDPDGVLDLTAEHIRLLADRHAGIGGDGVIRVVRTRHVPEVADQAGVAEWFMDYRNADGSLAEMCGNGMRVFVQYLAREGWIALTPAAFGVATRGGPRRVRLDDGQVSVDLGRWSLVGGEEALADGGDARVRVAGLPDMLPGLSVDLGNPHTVVLLPDQVDLAAADLSRSPMVEPLPASGTNVELIVLLEPDHLQMRVHERGVGETRSCGTGAAAAALVARAWTLSSGGEPQDVWRVDLPGGTVQVRVVGDQVELTGPAVLVADGVTDL